MKNLNISKPSNQDIPANITGKPELIYNNSRLLVRFDCTEEYPSSQYFSNCNTTIISSLVGKYRETDDKSLSRFGYRFAIENVGKPHLALIRYPDDKRRFMCVMDGTSYDLSTGVFTGGAVPLSGQMQEIRLVFWPRWKDCSITFMSWGHNQPAAVSSIEIYETSELIPLEIPCKLTDDFHRKMGIQYEDPCGAHGASEGALNFEEWLERITSYAKHTGQNYLVYPICWYHELLYPSKREPAGILGWAVDTDRTQYNFWTSNPPDWVATLLEHCERSGIEFTGAMTLLRLGSLMQKMNINLEAIQAGADTINNMLWCNQVQSGTMDWTKTYNIQHFAKLFDYQEDGDVFNPIGREN